MYAIIKTGGKQYRLNKGQILSVEKLNIGAGKKVVFDQLLMISDGKKINIGNPTIKGATVEASVIDNIRADKVKIIKFLRRKHSMKRQGHRQQLTKILINKINLGR